VFFTGVIILLFLGRGKGKAGSTGAPSGGTALGLCRFPEA